MRGSLFNYAIGHLVVWAERGKNLNVHTRGMQVLLDPAVRKVSIANPQHAPYGRRRPGRVNAGRSDQLSSLRK